jgi:ATP-dependent RNA helicase RhlE
MKGPNLLTFADLPLKDILRENISRLKYDTPTEIQAQALPVALDGADLIAGAQTGSGKTAVYALTILNKLKHISPSRPRALILSPTRELALQVEQSFSKYGRGSGLSGITIYGGANMSPQTMRLRRGVDVIIATPGRLFDHLEHGNVDLSRIEFFVLDEADRLLDMGFLPQVKRIADRLPENRQTMLFSATIDGQVEKLAAAYLSNPVIVNAQPRATTAPQIEQVVHRVTQPGKVDLLLSLLYQAKDEGGVGGTLIFTRTRSGADRLSQELSNCGFNAGCIHGEISQPQRERVLSRFRNGSCDVLVATDVAARGIDVPHITHVINFDVPVCAEDYIHRIGRTGRAGRSGKAYTFVTHGDTPQLRAIEKLVGMQLDPNPPDARERSRKPSTKQPTRSYYAPGRGGERSKPDYNRFGHGQDGRFSKRSNGAKLRSR